MIMGNPSWRYYFHCFLPLLPLQDFLIIYAAGNYGLDGYHSVGSPGTTKNALTIGATENGPNRMSVDVDYVAKFSSRGKIEGRETGGEDEVVEEEEG